MKYLRNRHLALILIITGILSMSAHGQSKNELKGDRLFEAYSFLAATNVYKKALDGEKDNSHLKLKLAHCYRMLNDPASTAKWYEEVIEDNNLINASDQYYFAEALSGIGNYEEARKWYESYSDLMPADERGTRYAATLNDLSSLYRDSLRYRIEKLSINSSSDDFSPALYGNGIVFVSGRNKSIAKFSWNKSAFLDLYVSEAANDQVFSEPIKFHRKVNTRVHEGPISFYANQTKMVFTRNNFEAGKVKKSSDGVTKLKLFFAEKTEDGKWGEFASFPYNNDEYSVGHPSITEDGKHLYFVSDMPDGHGGTDIYVSTFDGNHWSKPVNLGSPINTEGDEMFPFISSENQIYFASNGHGGLGGLDIFTSGMDGSGLVNLGYPLNTNKDDFGLVLDEEGNKGYFSSNRIAGAGDDIFKVQILEPTYVKMEGMVLDAYSKKPIEAASITMLNAYSRDDITSSTGQDGSFELEMKNNSRGTLKIKSTGYTSKNIAVDSKDFKEETNIIEILLEPEGILLEGIARNQKTGIPLRGATAVLTDRSDATSTSSMLDENGRYRIMLAPEKSYTLQIRQDRYFTKNINIRTKEDERRLSLDLDVEEIVLGKAIKIDNIYYDLNKWDIREDAAVELDKLVQILHDNPSIEVELGSHTDARGGDGYNQYLSQGRAESAVAYVISKGIDADRITGRGYGETKIINHCKNGVSCSKEEHQQNRRTEFTVIAY